jgi:hypothetical protein
MPPFNANRSENETGGHYEGWLGLMDFVGIREFNPRLKSP